MAWRRVGLHSPLGAFFVAGMLVSDLVLEAHNCQGLHDVADFTAS